MKSNHPIRYFLIAVILISGAYWSLASAQIEQRNREAETRYPEAGILATAQWLQEHQSDIGLVILDVRADKYYDGKVIPGAVRLPWSEFRYNNIGKNIGEMFQGVEKAQELLGQKGISRNTSLVLYDSVARDGGATASYVFWVLDVLGHKDKRVLDGGIDAWRAAGYELADGSKTLEAVLYQAPPEEMRRDLIIDGDFLLNRLGDPFYQIIDVRSHDEYVGTKGSTDLFGKGLNLGHVPTAVNIEYKTAWIDKETKKIKPYAELQELYRGIDPDRGVIVYCDSGRRSSFSYYILRLMGFSHVITYEHSWKEWGNPDNFYPVETIERKIVGGALPGTGKAAGMRTTTLSGPAASQAAGSPSGKPKGGYVSCGG